MASAMSTTDDPDPGDANSPASIRWQGVSESLQYAVTHIFLPVRLPVYDDYSPEEDLSLVHAFGTAAHLYRERVNEHEGPQWYSIARMLDKLQASLQSKRLDKGYIVSELHRMQPGDIFTFFIRRQNAAIVLTKRDDITLFEPFEVSPREFDVKNTAGLVCSYPWATVEVPNEVFENPDFQFEIAKFLSLPDAADSDIPPPPAARPQYITALLSGILRSIGRSVPTPSITKRIRDNVGEPEEDNDAVSNMGVWRRSSIWLLIRVAVQMSLDRSPVGRIFYKEFMLFFFCTFARNAKDEHLPSNILHLMASKILRRMSKLGSAVSDWLSQMALATCACFQEILDIRWRQFQSTHPQLSPFQSPSQEELARDTQLSLLGSRGYICDALANRYHESPSTPFHPSHDRRGTLDDFLSPSGADFFNDACEADSHMTLYDIELAVEQNIDGWFSRVSNVDDACAQLEVLMDGYLDEAHVQYVGNPENSSITFLTALELFIVLDKLVVKKIPMLADYSPEIPIAFLETLLLRKATHFHRLACAYQYLDMRHSQSRPGWSVLSNEFTEDSFSVRYYDQSPDLQQLKARIEQDCMEEDIGPPCGEHEDTCDQCQEDPHRQRLGNSRNMPRSQLPTSPLHAKIIVFELQCPQCIRIWRSAAPRILHYFRNPNFHYPNAKVEGEHDLLVHIPALRSYSVHYEPMDLVVQIRFAYFNAQLQDSRPQRVPSLGYVIQYPPPEELSVPDELGGTNSSDPEQRLSVWRPESIYVRPDDLQPPYKRTYNTTNHGDDCSSCSHLAKYVHYTFHTSNDALAAQSECPVDFSLDEFLTLAHLRSGGLLQWVNILRGLRSRTLNLRRHFVHYLLSQAVFQVGPLDLSTGTWIWHRELQDASFCSALLDELDALFVDVGTSSINGTIMSTISILVTRVLASSPSECVSERAIAFLRAVRKKTFSWVQELSYNLAKAPTNKERGALLLNMAAICRSTFDVDSNTLPKLFHSAEDVDAALSCSFLICSLRPEDRVNEVNSILFLPRDRRLSFALEDVLGDAILSDISDYGVDLAVCKIFASHKPSVCKWERLNSLNSRWFTCPTKATIKQPSQTVHFNILDGTLLVDGQLIEGLPRSIRGDRTCLEIFRDQGFFVISSHLPGMDFTTLSAVHDYKVHFSLKDDGVVVRAQCNQTNNIFQLIPAIQLEEDLPLSLIRGHVHWLNLSAQIIEIRPLERLWEQSSDNWRIDCASGSYRMYRGRETLVDIRSPTWDRVSEYFNCLNEAIPVFFRNRGKDLVITASPFDSQSQVLPMPRLSILLPHYGLSFFVSPNGELESCDFKDMVYDEDQCVGALFGMENFLVLRQKPHFPNGLVPRHVLVPNGRLINSGDYQVSMDTRYCPFDGPLYHTYIVDAELGCLAGNGNSDSSLHLAHLHAMTGYNRPDPLTGRTGAQAALCLFRSAGCQSVTKAEANRNWESDWLKNQYPQVHAAYHRIQLSYTIPRYRYDHDCFNLVDKRAMRRAAYLFPLDATGTISLEDCKDTDYLSLEADLELECIVFTATSAISRWLLNAPTMNTIRNWAALWCGDNIRADANPSYFPSPNRVDGLEGRIDLMRKLYAILENGKETNQRFLFLFLLPTMTYSSLSNQAGFLSMFIAFAEHLEPRCFPRNLSIPIHHELSDGYRPTEEVIWQHFRKAHLGPQEQYRLDPNMEKEIVHDAMQTLLKDWPSNVLPTVSQSKFSWWAHWWNVESLISTLRPLFSKCYSNFKLMELLVNILTGSGPSSPSLRLLHPPHAPNKKIPWQVTLDRLLSDRRAPDLPFRAGKLPYESYKIVSSNSELHATELSQLLSSLSISKSNFSLQQEYIAVLEKSSQCICEDGISQMTHQLLEKEYSINILGSHYEQCRTNYLGALDIVKKVLGPTSDPYQQALWEFARWPPITADVLLRCLASTSLINLPRSWKECLVSLALLLLDLQRARRLLKLALDGLEEEFSQELGNEVCDGWDPEEYPDWLLIQIQGNFLIRRTQFNVAKELMSPRSGENTVTQVNMGEGKSSVIIPIAVAFLANGEQLVRVVVPKALITQMFELLVSRLGGLVGRPIFCLPFTRPLDPTSSENQTQNNVRFTIDDVQEIMQHCIAERGILLVQPEHVASLKLTNIEEQIRKDRHTPEATPNFRKLIYKHTRTGLSLKLWQEDSLVGNIFRWLGRPQKCSAKNDSKQTELHGEQSKDARNTPQVASKWFDLQKWLDSHVRDILDESDEVLHARFQLIYTIGLQQHTDGYPDRWTIIQHVLRLVKKHAYSLSRYTSGLIEYECGPPGSFPYIHILRPLDVGRHMVSLVTEDVMAGELPNFHFKDVSPALRDAIRSFISDEDVLQVPETAKKAEGFAKTYSQQVWNGLLLLRGLLSSNALVFALAERRWRVDYGLALASSNTTMLAVPYRAKDVPAPNTHFGHPDIAIILTCLSYYYSGLSEKQLRVTFETLFDEDDPTVEYAHWVKEYGLGSRSLPDSLRVLGEINLRPSEQWDKTVFPLFRHNRATIDFYLSRIVFPQEMKEYPWKLCASSWDIAEKRERFTTGFSGTNDGRWLLPMSIAQHDLDYQRGTNARVLTYLLRHENNFYALTHGSSEYRSTVKFLQTVAAQQPKIRVLLDVGAQILDLSNRQVAKAWLDIEKAVAGAIYFNESDKLTVLMRNGLTVPLSSSSLSQQLDRCIVYLDHAHTRGTDVKLPLGSRAAVTLGPKVTKDGLVQGCMRMRKLGNGHSVMFFAPPEVDRSIRAVTAKKDPNTKVTVVDILSWAIHETWTDIQHRAPYWAQQGMNHKHRSNAWTDFTRNKIGREELADAWLQPELKTLAGLYAPSATKSSSCSLSRLDPEIRQRCKNLGILSLPDAQMAEEQERNVNREREREREVELPPKAKPADHFLHPDVVKLVKSGDIPPLNASNAFHPVFTTLGNSSAATCEANVWSPFILATADFCNTIQPESTQGTIDQYLRPVQWILTRKKDHHSLLVLLSPFEVDHLMPDIRASDFIHLHLYAPRTSKRMKPSDDLALYSIPPLPSDWAPPWGLIDQLNVFSGQLYLRNYDSYLRLCHFLGVPTKDSPNDTEVRWNLFNIPGSIEETEIKFASSPLPSIMALLAIRSRGRPFERTHMGQILQGHSLAPEDVDGPRTIISGQAATPATSPLSPIDMECDAPLTDGPGPPHLARPPKRWLEMGETPNANQASSKKRHRID